MKNAASRPQRVTEELCVPTSPRLSVLATAQRPSRQQRQGRYVPESMKHPARMLPAIAAHVITDYTGPGELVLDPMCGIGTTLVEAIHLGRDAAGMEYETDFAHLTLRNLRHARPKAPRGRRGWCAGTRATSPPCSPNYAARSRSC